MKKTKFQKTQISAFVDAIFTQNSKKKFTAGAVAFSLMAGVGLVHAAPLDVSSTTPGLNGFTTGTGVNANEGGAAFFNVTNTPFTNSDAGTSASYVIDIDPENLQRRGTLLSTSPDVWGLGPIGGTSSATFSNSDSQAQRNIKINSIRDEGISYTTAGNGRFDTVNLNTYIDTDLNTGFYIRNDRDAYASVRRADQESASVQDEVSIININADIYAAQYGVRVDGFQGSLTINNGSNIFGSQSLSDANGAGIYAVGELTYGNNNQSFGEDTTSLSTYGWGNSFALDNDGWINGQEYGVHVEGFSRVNITNTNRIGGQLGNNNAPEVGLNIVNVANYVPVDRYFNGDQLMLDVNIENTDGGSIIGQTGINISNVNYGTYAVNNSEFGVNQGSVFIRNTDGGRIEGVNGNAIQVYGLGGALIMQNGGLGEDSLIIGKVNGVSASYINGPVQIDNNSNGLIEGYFGSAINLSNTGGVLINNAGTLNSFGINNPDGEDSSYTVLVQDVVGGVTINNSGNILSSNDTGDYRGAINIYNVFNGVTINNTSTGEISSYGGDAIEVDQVLGNVNITNDGLISSRDMHAVHLMDITGNVSVVNAGTIQTGTNNDTTQFNAVVIADNIAGNIDIVNSGLMRYAHDGNLTSSDGYEGVIVVRGQTGRFQFTNTSTGVFESENDGFQLGGITGNVRIENYGTMSTPNDDFFEMRNDDGEDYGGITGNFNFVNGAGASVVAGDNLFKFNQEFDGDITINNAGTLTAENLLLDIRGNDSEITNLTVTNSGVMAGGVNVSDNGYGEDAVTTATFTNSGTWTLGGNRPDDEDFGAGDFYVRAGSTTLTNTGTINVAGDLSFETRGSFTFINSGTLDMTADGGTYSDLTIGNNTSNVTFNGAGGTIKVDALLGSSAGSTPASNNDTIEIDGIANGVTTLRVTDSSPTVAGVNNPTGSVVVTVTNNSTAPGAFVLANGPINKGLWQYDLYSTGGSNANPDTWRLASVPSSQAFELPQVISAAQRVWYLGADAAQERSQELRLSDGKRANGGAWAKVIGARDRSMVDNNYTLSGKTSNYNTDSNQSVSGLLVGADGSINLESGGQWLLGAMVGGTNAKQTFAATGSKSDADMATVGLYANYAGKDGGFFNFLVKSDLGKAEYSMNNGAGISAKQKISTNSLGAQIQTGYRFAAPYAFFEPVVGVGTVSVSSDTFNMLSTDVNTKGNSTRASLGFNTGFTVPVRSLTVEPFLSAKYVSELDGDNTVALTSGGQPVLNVRDTRAKNFGQYALGLKFAGSKSGSYGYVRVQHDAGSSTKSSSATAGLKVVW